MLPLHFPSSLIHSELLTGRLAAATDILPQPRRWLIRTETKTIAASDLAVSKKFAIEAARLLADTRCHNVILLDVSGLSPVTDFLVLASGTSPIQMKSACDHVEELGEPAGFKALTRSGDSGTWTCIDLVDVVVHVFSDEARAFYDLDSLWGDARKVDWKKESASAKTK